MRDDREGGEAPDHVQAADQDLDRHAGDHEVDEPARERRVGRAVDADRRPHDQDRHEDAHRAVRELDRLLRRDELGSSAPFMSGKSPNASPA